MAFSRRTLLSAAFAAGLSSRLPAADADAKPPYKLIGEPTYLLDKGTWELTVESPYQRVRNVIRILLPEKFKPAEPHRVLYVLPVEERLGTRWGDPLNEVLEKGLHDKHDLICVHPTFDTLPWYGRHAKDPAIRHEMYVTKVVVPLIERRYKTPATPAGRLLVGFSKSGFGAVSLLLRNPTVFGAAGSWDAPLVMEEQELGLFGTANHFGDKATFAEYLPLKLIATADEDFKKRSRLVITGHDSFGPNPLNRFKDRPHTETFHKELDRAGIKHVYNNDLKVKHHWNTGWLTTVVDELVKLLK